MMLGSAVAGSSNIFMASTVPLSGLAASAFVIGRSDNNVGIGTAVPLITMYPSNGATFFAGPISGNGSNITSVNAALWQGMTTNALASAFTNADGSLTISSKLNLTNAPAITGAFIETNYVSGSSANGFPATPDIGGAAWMGNSNGVVYLLTSKPFTLTWAATNKIAP